MQAQDRPSRANLLGDLGIETVAAGAFTIYQEGLLQHFNTLILTFGKDLKRVYRERCDLSTQVDMMTGLVDSDKTFLIKQFYSTASPEIGTDEALTDDMRDDFMTNRLKTMPIFRSLQLHVHWDDTPEDSKINIWKYVQQLWKCSSNYHEESKDSMIDRAMDVVRTPQFHETVMGLISGLGESGLGGEIDQPRIRTYISDLLSNIQRNTATRKELDIDAHPRDSADEQ